MTERNDPRRDQGTPGGLGGPEVTPDGGMVLDDGRVQFAPRESDTPGPFVGRGPRGSYPVGDVIADQVCALMTEAGGVDASSIDVHVHGDEVTLEGVVGSEALLTRTADGSLLVNGDPVIQQAEFPGGVIVLVTMTGVALAHRNELEQRPLAVA